MSMLLVCLPVLGCALAPAPSVQDPEPAAIVQPFGRLIGTWRGEGTVVPEPGDEPLRWDAHAHVRWVLGGQFAQEDLQASLGDERVLQQRTVFGWDGARDRFIAATIANNGAGRTAELTWTEPATLVATTVDGSVVQRSIWEFGDGRYTYRTERSTGAGAWHRVVEGAFVRVDASPPAMEEAARAGTEVGAEMARAAILAGAYTVEGERVDSTGRTVARASGTSTVRAMYGGHVVATDMRLEAGDAILESQRFIVWNAAAGHYDVFSFDDRGGLGMTPLRWDGEDVLTGATLESDGVESLLASTLIEVGSDGMRSVTARTIRTTGETVSRTTLRYRREEEPR